MSLTETLLPQILERLSRLPQEAILATVAPRGAEARAVMLRSFDPQTRQLFIHTDSATPKLAEIAAVPGGTLLLRDAGAGLQLRLRVTLCRAADDPALFHDLPAGAQQNYGVTPPPGTHIPGPDQYQRQPAAAAFAVISAKIEEIDIVDLAATPHRRAIFRWRGDGLSASWLSP